MSFSQLKIVMKVGNFLAVTPSYEEIEQSSFQKIHAFVMMGIITAGVMYAYIYRYNDYITFIPMKAAVQVCIDMSLYLINISTIFNALWKRSQWFILMKKLNQSENVAHETRYHLDFIICNIYFCAFQTYETYLFANNPKIDFFRQFTIEYLQLYAQFVIYFILQIFLRMFKSRYRSIANILNEQLSSLRQNGKFGKNYVSNCLPKMKYNICLLKECIDIFNDIFEWPILFIIMFTSLQVLMYLHVTFVGVFGTIQLVIYCLSFMFWHCVATFLNILLCDSVIREFDTILSLVRNMQKYFVRENGEENGEIQNFIETVKDNAPKFTAARFFAIKRATIFAIFNAVVSFLIVMIQFETSQKTKNSAIDCNSFCKCNGTES